MNNAKIRVVVFGSTGLIGSEIVRLLNGRGDLDVTALTRKSGSVPQESSVKEKVFDFTRDWPQLCSDAIPADVILCAVGTTMKKAGSQNAFLAVDRDIPLQILTRMEKAGNGVFGFVSSVGADKPRGFYLNTKAEVEHALDKSTVRHVIVRPSLLLGDRNEFRLGEEIATKVFLPVARLISRLTGGNIEAIERIKPISARDVAKALIAATIDAPSSERRCVLEGRSLFNAAGKTKQSGRLDQ